MTVSFHKFGDKFFPGTGDVKVIFEFFEECFDELSFVYLSFNKGNRRKGREVLRHKCSAQGWY